VDEKIELAFAEKFRALRKDLGYSQKDFAVQMDVAQNTINRIENGHRLPDLAFLARLREKFGVDLNWLVQSQEEVLPSTPPPALPVFDESQLVLPAEERRSERSLSVPVMGEATYAYRVRDEAMTPITRPGDYVVVEEIEPRLGDLVLCRSSTGVVQVRRLSQSDSKTLLLTTENMDYSTLQRGKEIVVLGRISLVIRLYEV
jgi:transcriptional regulator with XRE-family HTH domain